jgi:hypothetical protein
MRKSTRSTKLWCFAAALLSGMPVCADDLLRTVALSGGQSPDTPSGAVFSDLFLPVLNNAGETAFRGFLQQKSGGVTIFNDEGLWSEGSGALRLVARAGSQAPGAASGVNFTGVSLDPAFNDAGHVAFIGDLTLENGIDGLNYGVWSDDSGALALVARKGQQAPGTNSGQTFSGLGHPWLNNAGQIAFQAALEIGKNGVTEDNYQGIWRGETNALSIVVRQGDQAPGAPDGARFQDFERFAFNEAGRTVGVASLRTGAGGVTAANDAGIWAERAGALQLVAREGDQAPGTPLGAVFGGVDRELFKASVFGDPAINTAGRTAFRGWLLPESGGVSHENLRGIWSDLTGGLLLVARQGNQAPQAPPDAVFETFNDPVVNDAGHISFAATLRIGSGGVEDPNSSGIWAGPPDNLRLVARQGSQAPGTPAGAKFGTLLLHSLNRVGQSAFWTALQSGDGGVTSHNDFGIWAEDRSGALRLIIREGDVIDVDDGPQQDLRTVRSLSFNANSFDIRSSGFNDLGQLAFVAWFTDGSEGIFVSNLASLLPGDFNNDAVVDARDYVVWRSNLGTSNAIANDMSPGRVDEADYATWRAAYGSTSHTAVVKSELGTSVPEPTSIVLIYLGLLGLVATRSGRFLTRPAL